MAAHIFTAAAGGDHNATANWNGGVPTSSGGDVIIDHDTPGSPIQLDTNLPGTGVDHNSWGVGPNMAGKIGTVAAMYKLGSVVKPIRWAAALLQEGWLVSDSGKTSNVDVQRLGQSLNALHLFGGTFGTVAVSASVGAMTIGGGATLTTLLLAEKCGATVFVEDGATIANVIVAGQNAKLLIEEAPSSVLDVRAGEVHLIGDAPPTYALVRNSGGTIYWEMASASSGGTITLYDALGGTLLCDCGPQVPKEITAVNDFSGKIDKGNLGTLLTIAPAGYSGTIISTAPSGWGSA